MTVCKLLSFVCYQPNSMNSCFFVSRGTANIPEVMKTRLQLQGELLKSSDAPKVYKNVFDVFRKTWANEGLRGLQRGLGPAVSRCGKDFVSERSGKGG